jgi:hypothetical protein
VVRRCGEFVAGSWYLSSEIVREFYRRQSQTEKPAKPLDATFALALGKASLIE